MCPHILLLIIYLMFASYSGCLADAPLPLMLTVIPSDGTISYGGSRAGYDAGVINPQDDAITHMFLLKNTNSTPVAVDRLEESCICLEGGVEGHSLPLVLQPGKQIWVTVVLDTNLFGASRRHTVSVYLKGQRIPAASLEILGHMRPLFTFFPASLDFGTVAIGDRKTLPLTLTIAPGYCSGVNSASFLSLVSTTPDVFIEQVSITPPPAPVERNSDGEAIFHSDQVNQNAKIPTIISYRVTLAPSKQFGPLNAKVGLLDTEYTKRIISGSVIPITGQRLGELSASPGAINFGMVRAGQPSSRLLLLIGASPQSIHGLHVGVSVPYVSALLTDRAASATSKTLSSPAIKHAPDCEIWLEVSLKSDPPIGLTRASLNIVTEAGGVLIIPVSLFVIVPKEKGKQRSADSLRN